jgi:hypothetical protein
MPNKVGALFMKPGTAKTRPTIEMVNAVEGVDLVVWVGPLKHQAKGWFANIMTRSINGEGLIARM